MKVFHIIQLGWPTVHVFHVVTIPLFTIYMFHLVTLMFPEMNNFIRSIFLFVTTNVLITYLHWKYNVYLIYLYYTVKSRSLLIFSSICRHQSCIKLWRYSLSRLSRTLLYSMQIVHRARWKIHETNVGQLARARYVLSQALRRKIIIFFRHSRVP